MWFFVVEKVFFERKLHSEVLKWIDKPAIVVVTGMRQVGKTTLLEKVFNEIPSKNKAFFDLDNPLDQRVFREEDFANIWANLAPFGVSKSEKAYLFLDELQAMPSAVKAIKYLFDHFGVQFFVTGSSSFYLKNLFSESLAGRKVVLEMFPLDFEEFLAFKNTPSQFPATFEEKDGQKNRVAFEKTIKPYEEYLEWGGFPKVVLAQSLEDKKAFLEDIYKSFFEIDVRQLADFKNLAKLQGFLTLLMQRAGSKINVTRIASELEVSRETAYSYLSFLEATFFVSLVEPFSQSPDREVSGAKKVYLCDTGILNRFAKVSSGTILENAVYNALKKRGKTNYYQRRIGSEIDFVLPEQSVAIEAKETATIQDLRALEKTAAALGFKQKFVASKNFQDKPGFIPANLL